MEKSKKLIKIINRQINEFEVEEINIVFIFIYFYLIFK